MRQLETDNLLPVRRWVGNSRHWLSAFLATAPASPEVIAVIAMGFAVRESGHRRSDFDILLVYRGARPTVQAPMEVDIRFAPVEQLNELAAQGNEIVCWALKFGASLYDPENRWEQLQNHWSGRIPLPSLKQERARLRHWPAPGKCSNWMTIPPRTIWFWRR